MLVVPSLLVKQHELRGAFLRLAIAGLLLEQHHAAPPAQHHIYDSVAPKGLSSWNLYLVLHVVCNVHLHLHGVMLQDADSVDDFTCFDAMH